MEINLKSFAKLNLFLNVIGKRTDDFHEIESVFQSISISDCLRIKTSNKFKVIFNKSEISTKNNTVVSAYQFLKDFKKVPPVEVFIDKRIPSGAGLGGASSNAAALLVGMNKLFDLNLGSRGLHYLAEKVGSDVPYFLYGGLALVGGRGEKVFPLKHSLNAYYLLAVPEAKISTEWAYGEWDKLQYAESFSMANLVMSFKSNQVSEVRKNLRNSFTRIVKRNYPEIKKTIFSLENAGFPCSVSGTGCTVFTVLQNQKELERAKKALEHFEGNIYVAVESNKGVLEEACNLAQ